MKIREAMELIESTGLECQYVETAPGVWYSLLQSDFDENGWDWREQARCYGPFSSEEQAHEHLRMNHANPGGSSTITFSGEEPDATMQKLMGEAPEYMKHTRLPDDYAGGSTGRNFGRWGL